MARDYLHIMVLDYGVRNEEDIVTFKKKIKTMLFDDCNEFKKSAFKYSN